MEKELVNFKQEVDKWFSKSEVNKTYVYPWWSPLLKKEDESVVNLGSSNLFALPDLVNPAVMTTKSLKVDQIAKSESYHNAQETKKGHKWISLNSKPLINLIP